MFLQILTVSVNKQNKTMYNLLQWQIVPAGLLVFY